MTYFPPKAGEPYFSISVPTFPQTLRAHYERTPDRLALRLVSAKQPDIEITYCDLIEKSAGFAQQYADAGVKPGEVIIIILQHGEALVYAFWGAVLHGAVPSLLPWLTEKLSPEKYRADLAALVGLTQPGAVVTYPAFEGEVRAAIADSREQGAESRSQPSAFCPLPTLLVAADTSVTSPDWPTLGGMARMADDLVVLQHSSGSTGLQKGVALSHGAVFNQLNAYAAAIKLDPAQDVIVSWLPLYHDMGLIASFLMPVLLGVPVVLLSPFDWVRAPVKLLQLISTHNGTLTWLPNFAFNFMAQKIRDRDLRDRDLGDRDLRDVRLDSMRLFVNCSEPTFAASHQVFVQRFAAYGVIPEMLTTCYAMAENVFAVTQGMGHGAWTEARGALLSAGLPLPNVRVRIVGSDGDDATAGAVGEITLQSDCMLTGYYHRPDATAQAIHDGWYFTGDLGYLDAQTGELFVTGRKKDLIIVGGKNIYPQDLERLADKVPGVHAGRTVAFGVFDASAGTEEVVLLAESDVVGEDAQNELALAVRQFITKNSDVAVRMVEIMPLGTLLKTSSGKIARAANRERYLFKLP